MKHTGDYELDEINMLEKECSDLEEENKRLEEENKRLLLHIEAKDKAYIALLEDYEELKKERDEMKAEIEEWLNAIRQKI